MLRRKALIIGSPGKSGTKEFLQGVALDLDNYRDYLFSPIGGYWQQNEVVVMRDPSLQEVVMELSRLTADYALLVFSGHGYHNGSTTVFDLRDDKEIKIDQFRNRVHKQTIIADCCRKLTVVVNEAKFLVEALALGRGLNSDRCRAYYDELIEESGRGAKGGEEVVLYACGVDETATDLSNRGGAYSSSLIEVAENWAQDQLRSLNQNIISKDFLSVISAHAKAEVEVRNRRYRQTPQIERPRTAGGHFPFCVVA